MNKKISHHITPRNKGIAVRIIEEIFFSVIALIPIALRIITLVLMLAVVLTPSFYLLSYINHLTTTISSWVCALIWTLGTVISIFLYGALFNKSNDRLFDLITSLTEALNGWVSQERNR